MCFYRHEFIRGLSAIIFLAYSFVPSPTSNIRSIGYSEFPSSIANKERGTDLKSWKYCNWQPCATAQGRWYTLRHVFTKQPIVALFLPHSEHTCARRKRSARPGRPED